MTSSSRECDAAVSRLRSCRKFIVVESVIRFSVAKYDEFSGWNVDPNSNAELNPRSPVLNLTDRAE